MNDLQTLLARMERGEIIEEIILPIERVESALNERDDERFDSLWMEVFRQVEAAKVARGIMYDADPRVARLREMAYLKSFGRWKSPDLAGYISDDFGLIGDALTVGYVHPWLNAVASAYTNRTFPCGCLLPGVVDQ